jgi:hypothetical protein
VLDVVVSCTPSRPSTSQYPNQRLSLPPCLPPPTRPQVLRGVMFNKDVVVPGRMRRKIPNPRILLLDCPLEYKKGENQTNVELTKEEDWWVTPGVTPGWVGWWRVSAANVVCKGGIFKAGQHRWRLRGDEMQGGGWARGGGGGRGTFIAADMEGEHVSWWTLVTSVWVTRLARRTWWIGRIAVPQPGPAPPVAQRRLRCCERGGVEARRGTAELPC